MKLKWMVLFSCVIIVEEVSYVSRVPNKEGGMRIIRVLEMVRYNNRGLEQWGGG